MGFRAIYRLEALKEGFNVKSGKSLKALRTWGSSIRTADASAEEGLVFRSF